MKPIGPLTARYRPQCFAEVVGQNAIKAVLSRASAKDRIAPAYLFSGTRGVGKTTLARIFAKSLNCVTAPTNEPCNRCEACRRVTEGFAVDVLEIDGASNRGIDDAKRLKDDIGYAPLEGRYKVFIIDEAHMLTREAFNALLKTLEEPPSRVVFVLATTELHKFPPTIISRCQQFTFKSLSSAELKGHFAHVLEQEKIAFEEKALSLLAKRAAGSVRDGMSMLGQVLALGGEELTESDVRTVLGLAGQELFEELLTCIGSGNVLKICSLTASILEQGVDMGFFLREFGAMWRNLFVLRQIGRVGGPDKGGVGDGPGCLGEVGEASLSLLDMSKTEAAGLLEAAEPFSLAYIHAAWQLVLEGQRRVLDSLEPAPALELLLLNLAFLPKLIPVYSLPGDASLPKTEQTEANSSPVAGGNGEPQQGTAETKKEAENATLNADTSGRDDNFRAVANKDITANSFYETGAEEPTLAEQPKILEPDATSGVTENSSSALGGEAFPTTPPPIILSEPLASHFSEETSPPFLSGSEPGSEPSSESDLELDPESNLESGTEPYATSPPVSHVTVARGPEAESANFEGALSSEQEVALAVEFSWQNFLEYCKDSLKLAPQQAGEGGEVGEAGEEETGDVNHAPPIFEDDIPFVLFLRELSATTVQGELFGDTLVIVCTTHTSCERIINPAKGEQLSRLARAFLGKEVKVEFKKDIAAVTTKGLLNEANDNRFVKMLKEELGRVNVIRCDPIE